MARRRQGSGARRAAPAGRSARPRRGRTPRSAGAQPVIVASGVVVVVAVVIGVVIANLGPARYELAPAQEPTESVEIGWSNPRVQQVVAWANAIHDGGSFTLQQASDLAALQAQLGVEPERPLAGLSGEERRAVEQSVIEALVGDPRTEVFRSFQPAQARLDDEAMASSPTGTVLLQLPPRPGSSYAEAWTKEGMPYHSSAEPQVRVSFRWEAPKAIVTGWEVVRAPAEPRKRAPTRPAHPEIPKPQLVERAFEGKKIRVAESELVPLPHFDDTPPALRAEIDALIEKMMDLSTPGGVVTRSVLRLEQIGRPAIPRLLTKMYETPPVGANKKALMPVIQAMRELSGERFGYNPTDREDALLAGTDEQRLSALKQWYAWWYENHAGDYETGKNKADDESLMLTEAEKKALESKPATGAAEPKNEKR